MIRLKMKRILAGWLFFLAVFLVAAPTGAREIKAFMRWCKRLPAKRVLVVDKLEMLFGAWLKCVEEGREWVHFNLDWEDAYIRRHDQLFRKRPV